MALIDLNRENLRSVIADDDLVLVERRAEHCGACRVLDRSPRSSGLGGLRPGKSGPTLLASG